MILTRKKYRTQEEKKLLEDLRITKLAWETALSNLEHLTDPELIDCCIYEMNAANVRYRFLLEQARNLNLRCPYMPSQMRMKGEA